MKIPKFLNINCQEATMLGSKQVDSKLNWVEILQLKLHYLICKPCKYFSKQVKIIHSSLKNVKNNTSISFSDEKKQTLQEKINLIHKNM